MDTIVDITILIYIILWEFMFSLTFFNINQILIRFSAFFIFAAIFIWNLFLSKIVLFKKFRFIIIVDNSLNKQLFILCYIRIWIFKVQRVQREFGLAFPLLLKDGVWFLIFLQYHLFIFPALHANAYKYNKAYGGSHDSNCDKGNIVR